MLVGPGRSRTVLITGCSRGGIGDALAQVFHQRGLHVIATARDLSKIQHLKDKGMTVLQMDVADLESIQNAVAHVSELTAGSLDFLINNAGRGYVSPAIDVDIEEVRKVLDTNVLGRFRVTKEFAPLLIKAAGTIVNIGSIAGVFPSPWRPTDNAAAGAVMQWSDTLRIEMEPLGVKVILIITGAIKTNYINNLPTTQLQPNSRYYPGKELIEGNMNAKNLQDSFMDVFTYAEQVVHAVLKRNPKKRVWAGGLVNQIWFVYTFLWSNAWDWLVATPLGITALKQNLAKEKAKAK